MKRIISYFAVLVVGLFAFVNITKAEENLTVTSTGSNSTQVVYIGRDGCGYCKAFVPGLKYLSEKYNFKYEYVNTDYLTETELDNWLKKLDVDPNEFGTPTFGVLSNGKLVSSHVGFIPEKELFDYLKENGVIGSDVTYEPQFKKIKFITNEEYLDIIKSGKKSFILFSQVTCSACLNARQDLEDLASELGVDVYYYDLGFVSEEEYNKFYKSNKFVTSALDDGTFQTPLYVVVKGDETLAAKTIYTNKADLKDFIVTNLKGKFDYKLFLVVVLFILLVGAGAYAAKLQLEIQELKSSKKVVKEIVKEEPKKEEKVEVKKVEPKKAVAKKPVAKKETKLATKKPAAKKPTTKTTKKVQKKK